MLFFLVSLPSAGLSQSLDSSVKLRNAYFGDLHLHTTNSFDAYVLMGTKVTPEQAYKFAKGEEIEFMGEKISRDTPLDFLAVTDHSENLGIFNTLSDAESEFSKSLFGRLFKIEFLKNNVFLKLFAGIRRGDGNIPGINAKAISTSAWRNHIQTTNQQYQPGKFTTFIAYEWTAMPDGQNLHRNIIFKTDHAPLPFSAYDSDRPEDLWTYLDNIRLNDQDVIAIPHNSNASNGLLFSTLDSDGKKFDDFYALRRSNNEPLIEISQNKGTSETHPALSPNDEFARFELFDHLLLNPKAPSQAQGSYAREALAKGL
ncbi:MAG: DUF3604 domain-containing protein, partial [Methylococcaceae bacterium]|nr:DUF3604 domain-containing protein [Methylococcaceae bacterium]